MCVLLVILIHRGENIKASPEGLYVNEKLPAGCTWAGNGTVGSFSMPHTSNKTASKAISACITACASMYVPWSMSRSLTRVGRENVPGIPDTTRNFSYLVRGPWRQFFCHCWHADFRNDNMLRRLWWQINILASLGFPCTEAISLDFILICDHFVVDVISSLGIIGASVGYPVGLTYEWLGSVGTFFLASIVGTVSGMLLYSTQYSPAFYSQNWGLLALYWMLFGTYFINIPHTVLLGEIPPSIHPDGVHEVASRGKPVSHIRLIFHGFN